MSAEDLEELEKQVDEDSAVLFENAGLKLNDVASQEIIIGSLPFTMSWVYTIRRGEQKQPTAMMLRKMRTSIANFVSKHVDMALRRNKLLAAIPSKLEKLLDSYVELLETKSTRLENTKLSILKYRRLALEELSECSYYRETELPNEYEQMLLDKRDFSGSVVLNWSISKNRSPIWKIDNAVKVVLTVSVYFRNYCIV